MNILNLFKKKQINKGGRKVITNIEIRKFKHAEVDAPNEVFGFLKIPSKHTLIRAEGEELEIVVTEKYVDDRCGFFTQGKCVCESEEEHERRVFLKN